MDGPDGPLFCLVARELGHISDEQCADWIGQWSGDKSVDLMELVSASCDLEEEQRDAIKELGDTVIASSLGYSLPYTLLNQLTRLEDQDVNELLCSYLKGIVFTSGKHLDWSTDSERFRLLRSYSKGGIGQIRVAWDKQLQREVALKEIQFKFADNRAHRERFIQEASLTARLEHPGIVPIYATGMYSDGRPFYAMKLIRGKTLQQAIDEHHNDSLAANSLQFRRLLRRLAEVCSAVEYAHSHSLIHRDLKPENIMLGEFGEAILLDWGLAKDVGNVESESGIGETATVNPTSTRVGAAVGTPRYMSPEQARGDANLTKSTDVFALGSTLYYLLTGRAPYDGADFVDVMQRAEMCDFPVPRSISPGVPKQLEAICLKAMAADPVDRYESAEELGSDLENYAEDHAIIAYPDSVFSKTARWIRKHRIATAAIAVGLIAVTLISTFSALSINRTLRESYFAQAIAIQAAREPGYGSRVRELMEKVGSHAEELDGLAVRNLMVATLSDFVANEPLFIEAKRPTCVAATNTELALGFREGYCEFYDLETGKPTGRISITNGNVIKAIHFDTDDNRMRLVTWHGRTFESKRDGNTWLTPKRLGQLQLPPGKAWGAAAMRSAEFDQQGARIVGRISDDNDVLVWSAQGDIVAHFNKDELAAGDELKNARLRGVVSVDGGSLIVANYNSSAYDQSGYVVWPIDGESADGLVFPVNRGSTYSTGIDSNGEVFAYGSEETAVYRIGDGREPKTVTSYREHIVKSLALSSDGTMLASLGEDASVILHDVRADQAVAKLRHDIFGGRNTLRFSPDQRHLLATNEQGVHVWKLYVPYVESLKGHDGIVTALAFDNSGSWLLSGSSDASLVARDESGNEVSKHKLGGAVSSVAFIPNSEYAVTVHGGEKNNCQVWNFSDWSPVEVVEDINGSVHSVAVSSDGSLVAFVGAYISLFRTNEDGERVLNKVWEEEPREYARAVAFDPNGDHLLVGLEQWDLEQYAVDDGTRPCTVATLAAGWPPCISRTATANWFIEQGEEKGAGQLKRWTSKEVTPAFMTRHTHTMSVSPSERYCAFTERGSMIVSIWDMHLDELLFALPAEGLSMVRSLAWSPRSDRLAIGRASGELTIWRIADLVDELSKKDLVKPSG